MRFDRKTSVFFSLFFFFIIIGVFFLVDRSSQKQNEIFLYEKIPPIEFDDEKIPEIEIDKDKIQMIEVDDEEAITKERNKEKEESRLFGEKIKELSTIPGIDAPVILVNGQAITKRSIESFKIEKRIQSYKIKTDSQTLLKRDIILMVRKKVVKLEAISKGIQPSQHEIDSYLEGQKESMKTSGAMQGCMEGMGMTEEEYLAELEESAYGMLQRADLRESFEASQEDKIQSESIERDIAPSVVKEEYWERYVDGLIKKAKIEILDPEIKKLFKIEVE